MYRPLGVRGWWQVNPASGPAVLALVDESSEDQLAPADAQVTALGWLAERGLGPRPCAAPALGATAPPTPGPGPAAWAQARWYSRLAGWPADGPENQIQGSGLLEGLGRAVRRLHDLPADASVPMVQLEDLLSEVGARVAAGVVDRENFAPARRRVEPQRLVDQLHALLPILERRRPVEPVLTHGGCQLGAVWLERTEPTGFIGVQRLAVADPYRDLGAMARSLAGFFGAEALPGFFAAYGLSAPDPIRLEFYALLDELL